MNFVQKVLEHLKGGDEAKVNRFFKRVIKYLDDQVEIRKREIEDINDKFIDIRDRENDAIYNLDVEELKSVDTTKEYIKKYVDNIVEIKREITEEKEEIKIKEQEIVYFSELKAKLVEDNKEK
tara:strand:- start:715 stop:1083 length:369 start_codon:yes stop_codon:yes gene_type:complete